MRLTPLILIVALAGACDKTYVFQQPPTANQTGTNPTPLPQAQSAKIEYRVTGNAIGATIRHSDSLNGLTQVTSVLPYLTTWNSNQPSIFLSLEATPTGFPATITSAFFSVQIFVNGIVFREAASSSFVFSTLSVNGTWRNSQMIGSK
jgi:hypothetical protein